MTAAVRPAAGPSAAQDLHDIATLLAAFARLADEGELHELGLLFTQDARWSMPGIAWQGREQVVAGLSGLRDAGHAGPGSGNWHLVSNAEIDVDGDRGTARSCFQLVSTTSRQLLAVGRYQDRLERGPDGRWLLAQREVTTA